MRKLSSDEIKSIELSIMKELDRICREHGLTYSLAYGTALGAVRHGGFIPWDYFSGCAGPRKTASSNAMSLQGKRYSPGMVRTSPRTSR